MKPSPAIALLRDGGPVAQRLDDYEARPQQLSMAYQIEEAFTKGHHLIVEAGTGTGKSFSYLLPAIFQATSGIRRSKPVVISTSTIALQEQLDQSDIPFLRNATGREFSVVLAKGRGNYISKRRLEIAMARSGDELFDASGKSELEDIKIWSAQSKDGSKADLDFNPHSSVWEQIVSDANNCQGKRCPFYESCFFQRARKRVFNADVLIVNHSLFFTDLALKRGGVSFLPDYEYAILDEAHDAERTASDALGLRVSEGMVSHLLNRIAPSGEKRGRTAKGLLGRYLFLEETVGLPLKATRNAMRNYFLKVLNIFGSHRGKQLRLRQAPDLPKEMSRSLTDLAMALAEGAKIAPTEEAELEISAIVKRAAALAESVNVWSNQSDPGQVYWLERAGWGNTERTELRSAPIHVGEWLEETLFRKTRSVIMTSATLATGKGQSRNGAFSFLRDRLGLPQFRAEDSMSPWIAQELMDASKEVPEQPSKEALDTKGEIDPSDAQIEMGLAGRYDEKPEEGSAARELQLGSPFDYANQVRLRIPDIPMPNAPGYHEALVEEAKKACLDSQGGVFLLFTSYTQLNAVYSSLEAELGFHGFILLKQGGGQTRTKMLDTFKSQKRCVLFGVETFWQGVDVAGAALSTVVIAKLPFPVPSDPLVEARSEQIEAMGGNSFMDYSVPQAIIKLKQGFGRLIRRASDSGEVVILDSRLRHKAYGRHFINALPPARLDLD